MRQNRVRVLGIFHICSLFSHFSSLGKPVPKRVKMTILGTGFEPKIPELLQAHLADRVLKRVKMTILGTGFEPKMPELLQALKRISFVWGKW